MAKVTDRRELRRKLLQIAGTQSGLFTAAQAREAGYSYPAQKYHVDHGNWTRIDRGIFRLPEWPPGPHEDLVRWVLWTHNRGVVSHETAMSVYGLGDVDPTRTHLIVPTGFRKTAPGVLLHRVSLHHDDIHRHDGFPITTPVRTLLDVASGDLDLDQLAGAIQEAIASGRATRRELLLRADALGAHAALRVERAFKGQD